MSEVKKPEEHMISDQKEREIKSINYNWFYTSSEGQVFDTIIVGQIYGKTICKKIEYDALKKCFRVEYTDGSCYEIYNPNLVDYAKEEVG